MIKSRKSLRANPRNTKETKNAKEIMIEILEELYKKNKLNFKEIRNFLDPKISLSSGELEGILEALCNGDLIGIVKSTHRDFNSYYLTAEGLQIVRALDSADSFRAIAA